MTGKVDVLGVPVDTLTASALNEWIGDRIDRDNRALVLNVNAHAFNLSCHDRRFKELLARRADLVFADGAGVVLAARMLGATIPGRITYAEWTWELAAFAESRGHSLYLLGAKPGTAARAADRLRERYPALRIVGEHHGYFEQSAGSPENRDVVARINAANPDILIVGFGMPRQELWLEDNWEELSVRIGLSGGAVFDYVSGDTRRGPEILVNHGLESVARLLVEPKRLFRRYVFGNPAFLARVVRERWRRHIAASGGKWIVRTARHDPTMQCEDRKDSAQVHAYRGER